MFKLMAYHPVSLTKFDDKTLKKCPFKKSIIEYVFARLSLLAIVQCMLLFLFCLIPVNYEKHLKQL